MDVNLNYPIVFCIFTLPWKHVYTVASSSLPINNIIALLIYTVWRGGGDKKKLRTKLRGNLLNWLYNFEGKSNQHEKFTFLHSVARAENKLKVRVKAQ